MASSPPVEDLDAAVALVYAQPPSGFVAARGALVKELKAAKRKEDAAAVAALRRPTKMAWALGEAIRRRPEAAEAFFAAVEALAEPGGDLRRRTADLRSAVADLVGAAEGVDPGEANAALMATAADPEATDALRRSRLADVPAAGGFGGLSFGVAVPADAPPTSAAEEAPEEAPPAEERARQEQEAQARAERIAALEADLAAAAAAEQEAAERLRIAQAALDEAQAERDRAAAAHEEAREAKEAAAELLRSFPAT